MNKILLLFLMCISFTSCFEVVEEVSMNADGSGFVRVVLDLSESKDNIKEYLKSGEVNGTDLPDQTELNKYLDKIAQTMRTVTGMSKVESSGDFNDFVFTFSGNFNNISVVNIAVDNITKELSRGMIPIQNKYEFANNRFVRSFKNSVTPAEYAKLPPMQKFVLESARLVSIYRFVKPIKKYSNKSAEIFPSKKTIKFSSSLGEIAKGTKTVENIISF